MSSSSENILLNSPALRSLKRAQLVQLCKRHGVKAVGKNSELVDKLLERGRNPAAARFLAHGERGSDDDTEGSFKAPAPRPSEAWSIVDEPSDTEFHMRFSNLSTINEFGGGEAASKASSVSSSIKALASSILHGGSSSSRHHKASARLAPPPLPIPEPEPEPVPEPEILFDKEPSPDPELNTSMSTIYRQDPGASTVRLVSSVSQAKVSSSPEYARPSPFRGKSMIPVATPSPLPLQGLQAPQDPSSPSRSPGASSDFSQLPKAFPQPPPLSFPGYAGPGSSTMSPQFTFRMPSSSTNHDERTNDAKSAILEEMNRRMGLTSGESGSVDVSLLANATKKRAREDDEEASKPQTSRFGGVHQKEFDRMPSIADHYAARRPSPRKSSMPRNSSGRPRTSRTSLAPRRSIHATRARISSHARVTSSTFAENDAAEEPASKRPRTSAFMPGSFETEPLSTTAAVVPPSNPKPIPRASNADGVVNLSIEAKKRVDAAKARRKSKTRSSMGRQSMGRNAVLGPAKPKGLGSRFGFLKSSAKLMRHVYASVVGTDTTTSETSKVKPQAASSSLPLPTKKVTPLSTSQADETKKVGASRPTHPPINPSSKAPSEGKYRKRSSVMPSASTGSGISRPGLASRESSHVRKVSASGSSTRSGVPTLWDNSTITKSTVGSSRSSLKSTATSRVSRPPSLNPSSTVRSDAGLNHSSLSGAASSMGLRRPSKINHPGSGSGNSSFSAPTASSLARMRKPSTNTSIGRPSHLSTVKEQNPPTTTITTPSPVQMPGTPNRFGFVATPSSTGALTSPRFLLPTSPLNRAVPGTGRPPGTSPLSRNVPQPFSFSSGDFTPGTPAVKARSPVGGGNVFEAIQNVSAEGHDENSFQREARTKTAAPLLPRNTVDVGAGSGSVSRRPRISRSRIIAKLGEKRAAAAAAAAGGTESALPAVRPKLRSSLAVQARTRRSFAAPGGTPSGKERAVLDSFHRGQRKSEVAARRRSRFRSGAALLPRASTDT